MDQFANICLSCHDDIDGDDVGVSKPLPLTYLPSLCPVFRHSSNSSNDLSACCQKVSLHFLVSSQILIFL